MTAPNGFAEKVGNRRAALSIARDMQFEERPMRPVTRDLFAAPLEVQLGDTTIRVADPAMRSIFVGIPKLSENRGPVLVSGETGVGKEIIARGLHYLSGDRDGPFVPINCGGLSPALIETELFGHERGAFTGAVDAKIGLIEAAAGGTLMLDEIGEMPLELQTRLLRLLDRNEIRRVGGTHLRHVQLRVVAATNRDLDVEVRAGRFRADLLYRLKGASVHVPPLRDRPLDIPILAQDLLVVARTRRGRGRLSISEHAMFAIVRYRWPGNVRELKHAMELVALVDDVDTIEIEHLPDKICAGANEIPPKIPPPVGASQFPPDFRQTLEQEIDELARLRMFQALQAANGVVARAARLLGMSRRTFFAWMKRYGLSRVDA